jgi:hypothetical protein
MSRASRIAALRFVLALALCLALPVPIGTSLQEAAAPARVVESHINGQIDPVVADLPGPWHRPGQP